MSMLGEQIDELREKAKLLRIHADGLNAPYVVPSTKELMALTMLDSASRMEQAADTIESLRDRLQPVPAELDYIEDKSRWCQLFGTPERAARTMAGKCGDCFECVLENDCEYGCDEGCLLSNEGDYDTVLGWLRSDA